MKIPRIQKLFYFLVFTSLYQCISSAGVCPPSTVDISPCQCVDSDSNADQNSIQTNPTAIRCFGRESFNLAAIFDTLNANIEPENKAFSVFYLNNTAIAEIPENVFKDISFERIYLDGTRKLKILNPKAFRSSEITLQYVHVWDTGLNIHSGNLANLKQFGDHLNLKFLDFSTSNCPPQELMSVECTCHKWGEFERTGNHEIPVITCKHVENSEALVELFKRLGSGLKQSKKNFFRFTLEDSLVDELPNNLFNGITFSEIIIKECPKLTRIDRNVFKTIKSFVNSLTLYDISVNRDSEQIDNLWHAISSLNNLVDLNLVNVLQEIPVRAFKYVDERPQTRLKSFSHSSLATNTSLVKISSFAFYNLPNIELINLHSNQLQTISKYAFASRYQSGKTVVINLSRNNLIPTAFESGSLSGTRRPVKLQLGAPFIGCNKNMIYLEESVFSPFLDKEHNQLDMGCTYIMQCDCKMRWLYDAPLFWREKISSGVLADVVLPCLFEAEDGDEEVSLWELPTDYISCVTEKSSEAVDNLGGYAKQSEFERLWNDITQIF